VSYRILITDTCLDLIEKIGDQKIQRTLLERIQKLSYEPDKQGKALVKDLAGFRSVHSAGRYRILYKIEKRTIIVYVLVVGIRKEGDKKDIYQVAKKLLRAGLLDLDEA
jgi:mRNA interferase RelE/StbE